MAPYVGQDLSLEAQLGNGLTVLATLLTGTRARQLDAVDAESVELLGDLDLGLGVEVGVGELLALS